MQAEAISAAQKKKIAAIEKDNKLSDKERFKQIDAVMKEEEGKMCKECGKVHEGSCMGEDNTNDKSDDGEGMDKVQPKALKKKFDDRKDKDIDNDGDEDESDEYLHNRRKTVSKAVKEEEEIDENKAIIKIYQDMKAQGKKDHNILDYIGSMPKYKRISRDQMAKIIGDAKRKGIFKEEVELDEAPRRKRAPKLKGDSIKIQRAKDAELNKALGRTKTGRKKPVRTMTSTQKALASLRKEEVEQIEELTAAEKKLINQMYDKKGNLTPMGKKVMAHGKANSKLTPGARDADNARRKEYNAYQKSMRGEEAVEEARQLKNPKTEVMVVDKGGKTIVIDKTKQKEYLAKGWRLAESVNEIMSPMRNRFGPAVDSKKFNVYKKHMKDNKLDEPTVYMAYQNPASAEAKRMMKNPAYAKGLELYKASIRESNVDEAVELELDEKKKINPDQIRKALASDKAKAKGKDKVSLKKAPWDKNEEVEDEMPVETGKKKKDPKKDPKNKSGEEIDVEPTLDEASEMTPEQEKMREKYVMKLKSRMDEFKKKYGDRAEKIMYATATKMAMKK